MADEIARRLVHASGTGLPALHLLGLTDWRTVQYLLVVGAAVALALEVIRLVVGLDWAIYDRLTREYEQDNLAGYALYLVSAAAVGLLAPEHVAIPAILMLTIGDPISGLLGSGSLTKETYVLLAMFGVCTGIASFFVHWVPAVLGGLAATAADGLKPVVAGYVLDDNLTIPPAAAVAMVAGIELVATLSL
ncbi:dolichol kinase [Halomicrobium sp. LC1Hm]|uniref:dolichol kinase n=1 Tax=Halomicrobium sp. LC1Hm TaxID=2610902 RepID=UPI0012984CE5|nr:dolichol kinase [Halomicrobium sp. LC1Hm]QGA84322.1 Dolichol kinase [Halomicrobium sp. LC1Hm]